MQYYATLAPVTRHQPAAHAQAARVTGACRNGLVRLQTFRHLGSWRLLSSAPETEAVVYGGGSGGLNNKQPRPQQDKPANAAARRVTLATLRGKHRRGEPISMVTAYDYSSAVHVDSAGVDLILVGDSAAMVAHGHDTTLPITLDLMLEHCRAVARGAPRPLLVGDLPFGCYESSAAQVHCLHVMDAPLSPHSLDQILRCDEGRMVPNCYSPQCSQHLNLAFVSLSKGRAVISILSL